MCRLEYVQNPVVLCALSTIKRPFEFLCDFSGERECVHGSVAVDVWVPRRGYVHYSFTCSHWLLRMQQRPRRTDTHSQGQGEHACRWDDTMIYYVFRTLALRFVYLLYFTFFIWFSHFSVYTFPLFLLHSGWRARYCLSFVLPFTSLRLFYSLDFSRVPPPPWIRRVMMPVACVCAACARLHRCMGERTFFIYLSFFLASNAARRKKKKQITHKYIRESARGYGERNMLHYFLFLVIGFFLFRRSH